MAEQQFLKVECKRASFWRAGRKWLREPTYVQLDALTDDEIEQLRNEPMLRVQEVDSDAIIDEIPDDSARVETVRQAEAAPAEPPENPNGNSDQNADDDSGNETGKESGGASNDETEKESGDESENDETGKEDGGESEDEPDEFEQLVRFMAGLDPNDQDVMTGSGKPDANVLGEKLNRKISAAERDEAWTECQRRAKENG